MAAYTPMIEQYLEIKQTYPDEIVFFRLGDFYEMFFTDAIRASELLDIVLTSRDGGGGEKIPMCGVPYHAAANYVSRLTQQGMKVVICEQMEPPNPKKPLVKREVVKVITPGTTWDDNTLVADQNNYLAAAYITLNEIGLAVIDITTQSCRLMELAHDANHASLVNALQKLSPAECLLNGAEWIPHLKNHFQTDSLLFEAIQLPRLKLDELADILAEVTDQDWLKSMKSKLQSPGCLAFFMLIEYLKQTKNLPDHRLKPQVFQTANYMHLDQYTRRNLELVANVRDGKKEGSLIGVLDQCQTPMGKRKIRQLLLEPLVSIPAINRRLDAVEELKLTILLQQQLTELLHGIPDLERIAGKISSKIVLPRELIALKKSLAKLKNLPAFQARVTSPLLLELTAVDPATQVYQIIDSALQEEGYEQLGELFQSGYLVEMDEYRQLTHEGNQFLLRLEQEERVRTGIKNLKIGFNKVFGYYLEVSKGNLSNVPVDYIRKQTLANGERYISPALKQYEEKILSAKERLLQLENECYRALIEELNLYVDSLFLLADQIAMCDVLNNLAKIAFRNQYVRPVLANARQLTITHGRHPVVEQFLSGDKFVPNDLVMPEEKNFAVITGPNMGGKSTFMRQTAIIILMAQMGSFVPADQAVIGLTDKIFTRVGASDDLVLGQSTFMVEMLELANILENATAQSFIILDEIGRGTSTADGLSIAEAVCEYIQHHIKARTLFATHFHELTSLVDSLSGVYNLSVSVLEVDNQVTFLKRVLPGKADKSYGIHVAALAGLPKEIIQNAEAKLLDFECKKTFFPIQSSLFEFAAEEPLKEELKNLDLDRITPREALQLLYRWQEENGRQ